MLSIKTRHRIMVWSRYHRALSVLVFLPVSIDREVSDPTRSNILLVVGCVAMCVLSGWMHKEAVSWWTDDPEYNH